MIFLVLTRSTPQVTVYTILSVQVSLTGFVQIPAFDEVKFEAASTLVRVHEHKVSLIAYICKASLVFFFLSCVILSFNFSDGDY